MKLSLQSQKKPKIEIIPMIDVIFFLLVFFIISSLAVKKTSSVSVSLPKTKLDSQNYPSRLELTIKKDGSLFLNNTPVQSENLVQLISMSTQHTKPEILIVKADENVPYGVVVKAISAAKQAGIPKFAMSAHQSR